MKRLVLFLMIFAMLGGSGIWAQTKLIASLAEIPGLANAAGTEGVLVEIVKAIDEVYEGDIEIRVAPFVRSLQNVMQGRADFHIPGWVEFTPDPSKSYPLARVPYPLGKVEMVLYSNAAKPISKKDIDSAMAKGGPFPYVIEVGVQEMFNFPTAPSNDTIQSLKKVQAGRIDGYLWPPEADVNVRELNLNRIHREFLALYDDPIIVQNSERGVEVSEILDKALRKLDAQGRLEGLHAQMHMPYQKWQPHESMK